MAATSIPYNNFRKLLSKASDPGGPVDYLADTIKALVVDSTYVPDYDVHKYLSDVSAKEIAGAAAMGYARKTLSNKVLAAITGANGKFVWKADPIVQTAAGGQIKGRYVILYKDTGVAGTSPLIGVILPDATPADITIPDGGTWTETGDPTTGFVYV